MKIYVGPIIWPLFLILFTLKLTGQVDWSWFAVLAPLWVPFVMLMLGVAIGSAISVVVATFGVVKDAGKERNQ